ncbi:MAG: hypothetical protein E6J41_26545 [Chloroflexi bacterium]|nr:MAG: hypothetical protein E6J41_26545 [Chloroflexota bacterium]
MAISVVLLSWVASARTRSLIVRARCWTTVVYCWKAKTADADVSSVSMASAATAPRRSRVARRWCRRDLAMKSRAVGLRSRA